MFREKSLYVMAAAVALKHCIALRKEMLLTDNVVLADQFLCSVNIIQVMSVSSVCWVGIHGWFLLNRSFTVSYLFIICNLLPFTSTLPRVGKEMMMMVMTIKLTHVCGGNTLLNKVTCFIQLCLTPTARTW